MNKITDANELLTLLEAQGWNEVLQNNQLSIDLLYEIREHIPQTFEVWYLIFKFQSIDEGFIAINKKMLEMNDGLHWKTISACQYLSEDFIHQFRNKLDWEYICIKQTLSEEFIEKHSGYVDWYLISGWQNLSDSFVNEHSDKLDIEQLIKYEKNIASRINVNKL